MTQEKFFINKLYAKKATARAAFYVSGGKTHLQEDVFMLLGRRREKWGREDRFGMLFAFYFCRKNCAGNAGHTNVTMDFYSLVKALKGRGDFLQGQELKPEEVKNVRDHQKLCTETRPSDKICRDEQSE